MATAGSALAEVLARARANAVPGQAPRQAVRCGVCLDSGYVRQEPGPGELVRRAVLCPACAATRQRERFERVWPAPPQFEALAEARLVALTQGDAAARAAFAEAVQVTRDFITAWPAGVVVVFDGNYGVGKTHLLSVIYARARAAGKAAIYRSATLLERMLQNFKGADEYRDDEMPPDQVWRAKAGRITQRQDGESYAERSLFTIVDERQMAGRSTILAGNDLARLLHPGIQSRARAADGAWVDLSTVPDARAAFARHAPGWRSAPATSQEARR